MKVLGGRHPLCSSLVAAFVLPCVVQAWSSSYYYQRETSIRCIDSKEESPAKVHDDDAKFANRLVIFGLGNIGSLFATTTTTSKGSVLGGESAPVFEHVCGTTRNISKNIPGAQAIHFEDYQELAENLRRCTHVLVTIPPVSPSVDLDCNNDGFVVGGRRRRWKYFCDPVLNHPMFSLNELVPSNTWIGYISSTSVYGNHDGEWVTEESEVKCEPGTKGELIFRAENEWRDAARECGWRLHVFRSSGLYGNTRSALHTVRNGNCDKLEQPSGSKELSFTSRIHEEDVTRAIISAMQYKQPLAGDSCLWNLADDCPASRAEVMSFGKTLLEEAQCLGSSTIRTISQQIQTERTRRRSTDRKRVQNQKMKSLLLPDGELIYPTYREGLRSVLDFNSKAWTSKGNDN